MSRRRYRFFANQQIEEPTVNLTPLIDVVFVILIMFIVIAPLLELDHVELAKASDVPIKSVSVQENSPISIHVRQDNTIWIDHQPMSVNQLKEYLKQAKKRFPLAKPQLYHDHRAQFGIYQSIKNAVEIAGFQQMDVILQP
jgi:biopolymer transport protein ExbD